MKRTSIRRRLMLGVAAVQIVAAILATVLVSRYEERRSLAMLESALVERAAMLSAVIEPPDRWREQVLLHRELLTLPKRDVYELSDPSGQLIAASSNWRLTGPLPQQTRSFQTLRIGERKYRIIIERDVAMFDDNPQKMAKLPKLTLVYGSPMSGLEEHERLVAWIAASIGMAILLASLAATAWVVRSGLVPLMHLAGSAARIDESNWRWESDNPDAEAEELVPLSLALSRLVDRLRTAFERERQFSADAAHEMKTAIAIIKSTLQLALERRGAAADYRLGIERALDDTERMQGLASGMLQLAKVEGLAVTDASLPVTDVAAEVREVERQLGSLLAARKIDVFVLGSLQPISAKISADNIHVILKNLLENAIHYSGDYSHIDVEVEATSSTCTITISDAGCGIHPDALPHIFERFYRGDESRSRDSGGAGLGLAIVHAVVQRAGGSITAQSTLGKGSTFKVQLPRV